MNKTMNKSKTEEQEHITRVITSQELREAFRAARWSSAKMHAAIAELEKAAR